MTIYEHLRSLLAIPSPSWREDGVSAYIIDRMTECGYAFRDDECGNLLFWRSMDGPKPMLCCHMDTVERAVEPHVLEDDETFFTDGLTALGADDKAAIAAVLAAAEDRPDALFLFTRAEELGLQGSAKLKKEFFMPFDISGAYVLDAEGDVGTCIISAPGKSRIELTIHGRTAHAGFSPEDGINAAKAAAVAVAAAPTGRIDDETTCNIGSLMAPGSTNIVPDAATAIYEVRSLSDEKRRKVSDEIVGCFRKAAGACGATLEEHLTELYSPYSLDRSDPALGKAMEAIRGIGREARLKATAGGSDANCIRRLGIDAITLSIGYENAHSVSERIAKESMEELLRLIRKLV